MSKLIAVRLPDGLYETLSKNAEQTGQTVSQLVIQGLETVLFNVAPIGKKTMTSLVEDMAGYLNSQPIKQVQSTVKEMRAAFESAVPIGRPKHAETCKCLICKPPKP